MSSILDLEVLLTRIASLTKRVIDYRTFGILLLNETTNVLEMKLAVRYGEANAAKNIKLGEGLVGWAALHKEPVLVADVSKDPRYVNLVEDVQSELVIPMLIKERCIGVFDLESPELNAFTKDNKEMLTLLASQAAIAIENARLYEQVRRNEERIEKELRFAQRVQAALLPSEPPTRLRNADVAGRFCAGPRARGRPARLHRARAEQPRRGRRDVSGKGAPAALYSAFAASRALAHRPAPVHAREVQRRRRPAVDEHHPARPAARGVLLHAVLLVLRLQAARGDDLEFRTAVPDPVHRDRMRPDRAARRAARLVLRRDLRRGHDSAPRGRRVHLLHRRHLRGRGADGRDFGAKRICDVVSQNRKETAREIVDAIFDAVIMFRGTAPQVDDMTAVAVKITA